MNVEALSDWAPMIIASVAFAGLIWRIARLEGQYDHLATKADIARVEGKIDGVERLIEGYFLQASKKESE